MSDNKIIVFTSINEFFGGSDNKRIYATIIGLLPIILFTINIFTIDIPLEEAFAFSTILLIAVLLYSLIIFTSIGEYFDGCFSLKKLLLKLVGLALLGYVFLFRIEVPLNYVEKMSQFDCDKNSKNIVKEVVKDNQITYYDYIRAAYSEASCISRNEEVEVRERELLEKKKQIDLIKDITNK